jgi:hypothetical protein
MYKSLAIALIALLSLNSHSHAQSYGYDDINAMFNSNTDFSANAMAMLQQQIEASQAAEQQIYQNAMNRPEVVAAYQQHVAAGGQMSLEQFSTRWVQTAGFNPVVARQWDNTIADINRRDRQNIIDTRNHINGVWRETMDERFDSNWRNGQIVGDLLSGQGPYSDGSGNQWTLPNTLSPGQYATDHYGNTFTVDQSGNYYRATPHGWVPMTYDR